MSLVDRMKESRKVEVMVGEMKFMARRPTLEDFGKLYNDNVNSYEMSSRYVTGWDGVKEKHLFPEGSEELVTFSAELFREYISDAPDVAEKIRDALVASLNDYVSKRDLLRKN